MLEIVRVKNSALRHLTQPIWTVAPNVSISAEQHAKVAHICAHLAYRLRSRIGPIIVSPLVFGWQRTRQEGNQMRFDSNRTGARAATAMWRATRLMQIEVDDIEAHITRACDTKHGVGVRAIVVQLPTGF